MSTEEQSQEHTKADTANSSNINGGALYLVLIQVVSRLLTFLGNQFLLRYVSPSLLGLAVQLELLSVTILYTSRESLRVALQRQPAGSLSGPKVDVRRKDVVQQAVNMGHLVLLVGLVNSAVFGYGYLRKSGPEITGSADFGLSLKLYALATFLELVAEPSFIVVQQTSLHKARARAETLAAISKCFSACLTSIIMSKQQYTLSVLPFAVGQLVYALALLILYQIAVLPLTQKVGFTLLPRRVDNEDNSSSPPQNLWGLLSKPLLQLTATLYTQSYFKLLLTQGDSLILSFVADLKAQGAFALASNYGGLLSRLLFQPIEESSRNVFGRLLAAPTPTPSQTSPRILADEKFEQRASPPDQTTSELSLGATAKGQDHESNIKLALNHLSTTLHTYTLFSLPILTLLPHTFPILVSTLIGSRWSSAAMSQLLSAYAYYLPFLAINGILDAFVTSVATPQDLRLQSILMMFVTFTYGGFAYILMAGSSNKPIINLFGGVLSIRGLDMGPAGLVWANMLNMTLRIIYSIWFIRRWIVANSAVTVSTVARGEAHDEKLNDAADQSIWRKSLPSQACVATAIALWVGLRSALNTTTSVAVTEKRFLGINGLDSNDAGVLVAGAMVMVTSMLLFEHHFLFSTLMAIVPERLAAKIRPHLPKRLKT